MIESYATVSEIAKRWGVKSRTIQIMCLKGKIQGVEKIGNMGMISVETGRPVDERIKPSKYIKEMEK